MYGAVTPVLIDKWGPPTADAVWVGGRVYWKQILQAFPLSPLLLPGFYFFRLLFTSHRFPLSEHLKQAMYNSKCERCRHDGLNSHPWPTPPPPRQMVSINDHWSVNENSEVVLKIFKVEFEIWLGKCNLMKRVENIRRARSNKRVEFKK